jgi:hypothetical protein
MRWRSSQALRRFHFERRTWSFWMIPFRSCRMFLAAPVLLMSSAISAEQPTNDTQFPSQAIKLADALAPELADAIKTCSVEKAKSVNDDVQDFIYKQWAWSTHYEKLKPYRVCFAMLMNVGATTRLVTNRFADAQPHAVAGPFDANYAACRKLADPSFDLKGIVGNAKWPARFGPEPSGKPCG